MISFDTAQSIIHQEAQKVEQENIRMEEALGRVLATDVFSDLDMPPFEKAAVDGYALRSRDLSQKLKVVEIIKAGHLPQKELKEGECAKIMTGSMVPIGADIVVMIEETNTDDEGFIKYFGKSKAANICHIGEDIQKGDKVLSEGTQIHPQHIAVLASVGATKINVYRKIRIGIISTGDEIVEPAEKPMPGQIRNSNAAQLIAQTAQSGHLPDYLGIAKDSPEALHFLLEQSEAKNDICLLSGGVSMGETDFVPGVLLERAYEILFKSIEVKPGKPTVFARKGNKYVFGLPGNPVSSFVQFELLVKQLLAKMWHSQPKSFVYMPLAADFHQKKGKRLSWIPINLAENGSIQPLSYHGSAHIHAYADADGMAAIPKGTEFLEKGSKLKVFLLRS